MIPLLKFKIEGHSMEPALLNGGIVFVSSIPYLFSKPKVGDIVAFKIDNKVLIKRIMKINPSPSSGEKYFVKGDNKSDSLDSKSIGLINKKDILGKVWFF